MKLGIGNASYKVVQHCYCLTDNSNYPYQKAATCNTFIIYKAGKDTAKKLQYADMTQFAQGHSGNLC